MVERIIELSVRHRWVVFGLVLLLSLWAVDSVRRTPLDALPDLSDPQVILYIDWMGRSPDLVEDQITYPLVRALQHLGQATEAAMHRQRLESRGYVPLQPWPTPEAGAMP